MDTNCTKKGFVRLFDSNNIFVGTLPTTCKTWGCSVCRRKLKQYFLMRIQYIASTEGPWYFITTTLRLAKGTLPADASSANKVLTAWLRHLKDGYPRLMYVKVPELTKNKQPHFHLMIGGLKDRVDCCGPVYKGKHRHPVSRRSVNRVCKVNCLEHELGKVWLYVTGDSYRIQVDRVYNAHGAGNYLSKYFSKTFDDHKEMVQAGFNNRYSMSRNIPKLQRLKLKGTAEESWGRVERVNYPSSRQLRQELMKEVRAAEVSPKEVLKKVGERYKIDELEVTQAKKIRRLLDADIS